jgi:hypothetical protein
MSALMVRRNKVLIKARRLPPPPAPAQIKDGRCAVNLFFAFAVVFQSKC